jgi:uncharacterized membrane protein HdeD (DUF308 family)
MLTILSRKWWLVLIRGMCFIVAGVIAMMWPGITQASLVALFALFAFIDGAVSVVLGMRGEPDGTIWWTMIFLGVLALAAGILAIAWPGLTLLVLLTIIAWFAIIRGLFEIVAAVKLRKVIDDEWVLGLSGAASILFGVLLMARPDKGLLVIALLIGAFMTALGVLAVALSLRLRRLQNKLAAAA